MTELRLGHQEVRPLAAQLRTNLEEDTIKRAVEIAERADLEHPINRSPNAVAVASLYIAGLLEAQKVTQGELSERCDVAVATIRACYLEIGEHEGLVESDRDLEPSDDGRWEVLKQKIRGAIGGETDGR